ncbi:MAG: methyltransferase domain-containing protein, partial [Pseudomonadota bacterium]
MVEQKWDAEAYAKTARFVSDLGIGAVDLLAPQADETIIDIGCGDGALTKKIMETGARVIGIDADPDMVAAARDAGVDAHVANAHDFEIP